MTTAGVAMKAKPISGVFLGSNHLDKSAAVARALAGSVPIAGPFLAELITAVIPNQRLDRVEDFLRKLAQDLERLSASSKVVELTNIPLIEEGLLQAARASTDARREYLARCVAQGVDADDANKLQELRILQILGSLGDDDILLLDAMNERGNWRKLRALEPDRLSVDASDSDRAKGELFRAMFPRLVALGVLSRSIYSDERVPPNYHTGVELEDTHFVSAIGRLILLRVGLDNTPASL